MSPGEPLAHVAPVAKFYSIPSIAYQQCCHVMNPLSDYQFMSLEISSVDFFGSSFLYEEVYFSKLVIHT